MCSKVINVQWTSMLSKKRVPYNTMLAYRRWNNSPCALGCDSQITMATIRCLLIRVSLIIDWVEKVNGIFYFVEIRGNENHFIGSSENHQQLHHFRCKHILPWLRHFPVAFVHIEHLCVICFTCSWAMSQNEILSFPLVNAKRKKRTNSKSTYNTETVMALEHTDERVRIFEQIFKLESVSFFPDNGNFFIVCIKLKQRIWKLCYFDATMNNSPQYNHKCTNDKSLFDSFKWELN